MSDLLKKLNVLIQSSIHEVLEDAQKTVSEPLKNIPRTRLGREIDSEVDKLRRKVNEALAYEDKLVKRVAELEREVADLDAQADDAVAQGDEVQARYLIERMKRAEQRKTMAESDLQSHRLAAQELIMRVNQLDAAVSEARHVESQQADNPPPPAQNVQAPPPRTVAPPKPVDDKPLSERASRLSAPTPKPAEPKPAVKAEDKPPAPPKVTETPAPKAAAPVEPVEEEAPSQPTRIPVTVEDSDESTPKAAAPVEEKPKPEVKPKPKKPIEPPIPERAEALSIVEQTRQDIEQSGKVLSDVLREAREKIEQMDELVESSYQSMLGDDGELSVMEQVQDAIKQDAVDEDIAARRSRLSAPPKPSKPDDKSE